MKFINQIRTDLKFNFKSVQKNIFLLKSEKKITLQNGFFWFCSRHFMFHF